MPALLGLIRATDRAVAHRPLTIASLLFFAVGIFFSQYFVLFEFYREEAVIREIGSATITLWGLLLTLVMSGTLVTHELEDRTAILLLAKPVRRSHFLLGKYAGLMTGILRGLLLLSLVFFLTLWIRGGIPEALAYDTWEHGPGSGEDWSATEVWGHLVTDSVAPRLGFVAQGLLLSLLQLSILCAIAVALAAFVPIPVTTTTTALVYVVGNLTQHLAASSTEGGRTLWTVLGRGLSWVLPNFGYMNPTVHLGEGKLLSPSFLLGLFVYSVLYTIIVLRVGALLFERREIR